jgi:hypothetical protein
MYEFLKIGGKRPEGCGTFEPRSRGDLRHDRPLRAEKARLPGPDDDSREAKTRTAGARRQ